MSDASRIDYPWWQPKNRWHSVDAHLDDGAGSMSVSLFPIKVANTLIMDSNNQIAFELPNLQVQNSFTLWWRSFPEWGRECVALSFAYKAIQYRIVEWPRLIATWITNDARPNIFDAPLMLILPWAYPQYVIIWFGIVYH